MTSLQILDKLTAIEHLLDHMLCLLKAKDTNPPPPPQEEADAASVVGENELPAAAEVADAPVAGTDADFDTYFTTYGTRDPHLSLREYDYSLSACDLKRSYSITRALREHPTIRVYYRLKALHKVWTPMDSSYAKNLETDLSFVKTNYMS